MLLIQLISCIGFHLTIQFEGSDLPNRSIFQVKFYQKRAVVTEYWNSYGIGLMAALGNIIISIIFPHSSVFLER